MVGWNTVQILFRENPPDSLKTRQMRTSSRGVWATQCCQQATASCARGVQSRQHEFSWGTGTDAVAEGPTKPEKLWLFVGWSEGSGKNPADPQEQLQRSSTAVSVKRVSRSLCATEVAVKLQCVWLRTELEATDCPAAETVSDSHVRDVLHHRIGRGINDP